MRRYPLKSDIFYVTQGAFWLILGKGGGFLSSFVIMAVFANYLSKEIVGTYQFTLAIIGLLAPFGLPGVDAMLTRSVAIGKESTLIPAIKMKFRWSLAGSMILFCLSIWYLIHSNLALSAIFFLSGIFFPILRITEIFQYFWDGRKDFKTKSIYTLLTTCLNTIFLIPTIFLTDNLAIIFLVFFLSHTLFDGFFLIRTFHHMRRSSEDADAISFGKHLTLIQTIILISLQIDKLIIWIFLGPIAVANYTFAQLPISKIQQFMPIISLSFPLLSKISFHRSREKVLKRFFLLFLFTIPASCFLIISAPLLYHFVFPNYTESQLYFQVLAISIAFMPFVFLETFFMSQLRKKELYLTQTFIPLFRIILFLVFTPIYGLWAIIFITLFTQLLHGIFLLYFTYRIH